MPTLGFHGFCRPPHLDAWPTTISTHTQPFGKQQGDSSMAKFLKVFFDPGSTVQSDCTAIFLFWWRTCAFGAHFQRFWWQPILTPLLATYHKLTSESHEQVCPGHHIYLLQLLNSCNTLNSALTAFISECSHIAFLLARTVSLVTTETHIILLYPGSLCLAQGMWRVCDPNGYQGPLQTERPHQFDLVFYSTML